VHRIVAEAEVIISGRLGGLLRPQVRAAAE